MKSCQIKVLAIQHEACTHTSCGFGEVPFHKYPERTSERHANSTRSNTRVACSVKSLCFSNSALDVCFTGERVLDQLASDKEIFHPSSGIAAGGPPMSLGYL